MMIKSRLDTEKANAVAGSGKLREVMGAILEDLKPEATYFVSDGSKRCAVLFIDMKDHSELPKIAELLFLAFDTETEAQPAMVPEDLMKAGPAIEAAVKRFG